MCYTVFISTNSEEDLSLKNSELVRFEKADAAKPDPCCVLLSFPNKWYVGSKTGCSCTFRHAGIELGFGEPEDWYPEEKDHLNATSELYSHIANLLSSGYKVDLVDTWYGAHPDEITTVEVSLDDVSSGAFRLFENHKFNFVREDT